jgi:hypothetical protein
MHQAVGYQLHSSWHCFHPTSPCKWVRGAFLHTCFVAHPLCTMLGVERNAVRSNGVVCRHHSAHTPLLAHACSWP